MQSSVRPGCLRSALTTEKRWEEITKKINKNRETEGKDKLGEQKKK